MSQKPTGAKPANTSNGRGLRTDILPDPARPDVGLVLMTQVSVESPDHQRAVLNGVTDAWAATPLPAAFLSRVSYASTDGSTVFGYGQWTSPEEYDEFRNSGGAGLGERMSAVPYVSPDAGPHRYRLYRSSYVERPADEQSADEQSQNPQPDGQRADGQRANSQRTDSQGLDGQPASGGRPTPGCVVVVTFETPGEAGARQLIDGIFEVTSGLSPNPGGLSAHFHISEDGTRVVNYAEWTGEEAHQRALDQNVQPGGAVRAAIDGVPGVRPLGFKRYVKYRGVVRG